MRTIDSKKIIGVRIWEDEEKWHRIEHLLVPTNNSMRFIEFKSVDDVDRLIKDLKQFKKDFLEIKEKGHL